MLETGLEARLLDSTDESRGMVIGLAGLLESAQGTPGVEAPPGVVGISGRSGRSESESWTGDSGWSEDFDNRRLSSWCRSGEDGAASLTD